MVPNRSSRTRLLVRLAFISIACTVVLLFLRPVLAGTGKIRLSLLVSASTMRNVNHTDALAACKVWMDTLGRSRGYDVESRFTVGNSIEEIRREVQTDSSDLFILDAFEYFRLAPLNLIRPFVVTTSSNGGVAVNYLLITRRDAAFSRLEDLRGKKIIYMPATDAQLGMAWTETLLAEKHLGRADAFFSQISNQGGSNACLPVFFGRADACLITATSWSVLKEMNPQTGMKLQIIATSPPYVETLVCLHSAFKEYLEDLRQSIANLHESLEGKQILLVFKSSRAQLCKESDLDSVRELWNKVRTLPAAARSTAQPPNPGPEELR